MAGEEEFEMSSSSASEGVTEEEANESEPPRNVPNRGNRDRERPNPPMQEHYGEIVEH